MSIFCMTLDFFTFFTNFSRRRFRCTIISILKQKTLQCFCFSLGKSGFPIVYAFFCFSIKNFYRRVFLWDIGGNNGFSLKKKAAVKLNSLQKFYDNGALAVLRKLTAVSAELPAILENNGESRKNFDPG